MKPNILKYPFRADPPHIGHNGGYPAGVNTKRYFLSRETSLSQTTGWNYFYPDSEFQEIFAYGIRNPGFWNPEFNSRNRKSR